MVRCNGDGHWTTPVRSEISVRHFSCRRCGDDEEDLLPAQARVRCVLLEDSFGGSLMKHPIGPVVESR